jgi:hypothetical protein
MLSPLAEEWLNAHQNEYTEFQDECIEKMARGALEHSNGGVEDEAFGSVDDVIDWALDELRDGANYMFFEWRKLKRVRRVLIAWGLGRLTGRLEGQQEKSPGPADRGSTLRLLRQAADRAVTPSESPATQPE